MLFERPVSLATTGISLAIMIPEYNALLEQPNRVPGTALIAGAVIGAIGICVGSAVAGSYRTRLGRILRLAVWGLLGLGVSVGTVYFGLRAPGYWHKAFFFGAGCLPFVVYVLVLLQGWRRAFLKTE